MKNLAIGIVALPVFLIAGLLLFWIGSLLLAAIILLGSVAVVVGAYLLKLCVLIAVIIGAIWISGAVCRSIAGAIKSV